MRKEGHLTAKPEETAVLIGISTRDQSIEKTIEYLDELDFLAETAQARVKKVFTQNLDRPDSKTYVGSGKMAEIAAYVEENEIAIAIFDDELTPSQIRNIELHLKCKILDRTNLILDIFAKRAQTATARTQVELAQYQYLLPRLTRMWTHLSKQRGGIGMKGPGEKEIETDRRIIRDKISLLKKELEKIDRQKQTQRKNRESLIRVALVGYTNVGKSTLLNLLSGSEVLAENKLFATLDTTVRKVTINDLAFLVSDTVGFIRKLPHQLVESFKSTLDEVRESDVLLHIVDISHPNFEEHMATVTRTLNEIKCSEKPIFTIFNKIDLYPQSEDEDGNVLNAEQGLEFFKQTYFAKENSGRCLFISAKKGVNIPTLKETLFNEVKNLHQIRYPGTIPYY